MRLIEVRIPYHTALEVSAMDILGKKIDEAIPPMYELSHTVAMEKEISSMDYIVTIGIFRKMDGDQYLLF